jgi:hypothetical protein
MNGTVLKQLVRERILKMSGAYPTLKLSRNGIPKTHYVHILVARAFLGKRPKGMQVCHKDGNPANPKLSNLRYDTPTGNALDRHRHGTHAKGESNPGAVLTEKQVRAIKRNLKENWSCAEIGELYCISRQTISSIKSGRTWGYVKI